MNYKITFVCYIIYIALRVVILRIVFIDIFFTVSHIIFVVVFFFSWVATARLFLELFLVRQFPDHGREAHGETRAQWRVVWGPGASGQRCARRSKRAEFLLRSRTKRNLLFKRLLSYLFVSFMTFTWQVWCLSFAFTNSIFTKSIFLFLRNPEEPRGQEVYRHIHPTSLFLAHFLPPPVTSFLESPFTSYINRFSPR